MMPIRRSQNWLPGIFNDFFGNEWIEKQVQMLLLLISLKMIRTTKSKLLLLD